MSKLYASSVAAQSSSTSLSQDSIALEGLLAKGDVEAARKLLATHISDKPLLDTVLAHLGKPSSSKSAEVKVAATSTAEKDVLTRVEEAIAAVRAGEFVVVTDGEERENEGDLIIAAEKATPEKLAFMINETSGLICVGVVGSRLDELELPQMVVRNTESHQTAFTVSVDYKVGTTTGISAADRAATIRALADRKTVAGDFARPGHMFPLRAKDGGVLERPGHTESSVDLARLAGLFPAGAMCEMVNKDGTMMRPDACRQFAAKHGLCAISIADLITYRKAKEAEAAKAKSA